MKREDFTFDSRDGVTKIWATRWIPDGEIKCILQIVHGMAEYVMRYDEAATWFANHGILVVGEDHLGHGRTVGEEGLKGYFCPQDPATVVVRDVHRLKKMTQEQYPGIPYFIWGHSMGSFILRNYMFKYGKGIDGAIVCGTATHPPIEVKMGLLLTNITALFKGEKHGARMVSNIAFGNPEKVEAGHFHDWICTDRAVVEAYTEDPFCGFLFTANGFKTMFTLLDRQNNIKNVKLMPKTLPVFLIAGSKDIVGNCGAGVKKVYDQYLEIGMKDVQMKLYEGMAHEIHNEPDKETVYQDMYDWITKRLA